MSDPSRAEDAPGDADLRHGAAAPAGDDVPRVAGAPAGDVPARSVDDAARTAGRSPADPADVSSDSVLPGAHRGGFSRLPTGPVGITMESAPAEPGTETLDVRWAMPEPAAPQRGISGWALAFSILGLAVSLFVGWGFPLGVAGIVAGILALRRPVESRAVAVWAIALGALSILYSAGWLLFAASSAGLLR